jgi:cation diffusion facilitator family transporter
MINRNRIAYLSLAGAVFVLALKFVAYMLTNSVALLSDAVESVVNVVAAFAVIVAMRYAQRPADYEHPYGHAKAEYLSSILEGGMILVAAGMILLSSVQRLFVPHPIENAVIGSVVAILAALVNGALFWFLQREAKRHDSVALSTNARHLLTDVWTSVGVIVAVLLVALTGWQRLDPLLAIVVSLNIVREGFAVMRQSVSQLMDERLPEDEEQKILDVLDANTQVLGYHRLRTRRSGFERFAEVDVFVDPMQSVAASHSLVIQLEHDIRQLLPKLVLTIHVEPFEKGRREGSHSPKEEFQNKS